MEGSRFAILRQILKPGSSRRRTFFQDMVAVQERSGAPAWEIPPSVSASCNPESLKDRGVALNVLTGPRCSWQLLA